MNDYRPVALSSHVMKVLERQMLFHLRHQVNFFFFDPLQFAYQPQVGMDGAVILYLLQKVHSHLDYNITTVRITFFDFLNAFTTIQPLLLGEMMRRMQVNTSMMSWVTDSSPCTPWTFSTAQISATFRKIVMTLWWSGASGVDRKGGPGIWSTTSWSGTGRTNEVLLNVANTKEMVVDDRRKRTITSSITIMGYTAEQYKYFGVYLNKLDWKVNSEVVYRKGMSRLYFLRKLRSFNVCSKMLNIFYQSVVASEIFFVAGCWGGGIRAGDAKEKKTQQTDKEDWYGLRLLSGQF